MGRGEALTLHYAVPLVLWDGTWGRTYSPLCNQFFTRVRKISKSDYWLRHVCPSVRMEQLGSHRTDFNEIWYLSVFRKSVEKIQVLLKSDKITGTLHKDLCTCMIISRRILLITRNVSDEICTENQNTRILCWNFFFRKSCHLWGKV
jgi:hypothetical protein